MANEVRSGEGTDTSKASRRARWQLAIAGASSHLVVWGWWFLREAWAITLVTTVQAFRLTRYGVSAVRQSMLGHAFHQAQLALGEQMFREGSGDEAIRADIRRLDEQIAEAREAKRSAAALLSRRKFLQETLAQSSLTDPGRQICCREYDRAVAIQADLKRVEAVKRSRKGKLFPSDVQTRRRIAIGFGLALIAAVGGSRVLIGRPADKAGEVVVDLQSISPGRKQRREAIAPQARLRQETAKAEDAGAIGNSQDIPSSSNNRSQYLEQLLDDPVFGRVNRVIAAEVGNRLSKQELGIRIGAVNELAMKAGVSADALLSRFRDAVTAAKPQGLSAVTALGAVSDNLAWQKAHDSQNDSNEAEAIAAIENLGGSVHHKDADPRQPVTGVSLRSTRATDDDMKYLRGFAAIDGLDISHTQITGAGLRHLRNLKAIQAINAFGCSLGDEGLEDLKELPKLDMLNLGGTKITNEGLRYVSRLKAVTDLNLAGTAVTDDGIQHLASIRRLEHLNLTGTKVTRDGVRRLKQAIPKATISGPGPFDVLPGE